MNRLLLLLLAAWIHVTVTAFAGVAEAAPCPPTLHGTWAVDGVYGPYTERAVRAFQASHHLAPDGVAGPNTLAALGWGRTPIVLKCGASGTTVQRLQLSLVKAGAWPPAAARSAPVPVAVATPRPAPTATPTPVATPSPSPTAPAKPRVVPPAASPRPSPTARPTAVPTAAPSSAPQVVVPLSPEGFVTMPALSPSLVEVSAGTWINSAFTGAGDTTLNPALPTWTYSASLWRGAWGVGFDYVRINPTGGAVTPVRFYQANTTMWDAAVKWRFDEGHSALSAGYRMLGQNNLDFVTLGLSTRHPLAGEWLRADAHGLLGGNGSGGYTVDGSAGLALSLRPVTLNLGYRTMLVSRLRAGEPVYVTSGPVAGLAIGF